MSIFEDNTFAQDKEYTESPSIGIGTYVYAQVELEEVEDQHLVVTMDECFATQTRDPEDGSSVKHFLIQDRWVSNEFIFIRQNIWGMLHAACNMT